MRRPRREPERYLWASFGAIGSSWGGDGIDAFSMPDLRGLFMRGVDMGQGRDPDAGGRGNIAPGGHTGDAVGTLENDAFASHTHTANISPNPHHHTVREPGGSGGSEDGGGQGLIPVSSSDVSLGVTVDAAGGSETRPKNVDVYYVIRYA